MDDLKKKILGSVEERPAPYPSLIEPCWIWKKATFTTGYGVLQWEGKARRVHRLSYRIFKGLIPEGVDVLHACDIPNCCNPSHLFLGNDTINAADRDSKNRQAKGEKHGMTGNGERIEGKKNGMYGRNRSGKSAGHFKISEENAREIHALYARRISPAELAERFNVRRGTIDSILLGKTWKNIYEEIYGA